MSVPGGLVDPARCVVQNHAGSTQEGGVNQIRNHHVHVLHGGQGLLANDVFDNVDIVTGQDSREDHKGGIHGMEDVHNPKTQSCSSCREIKIKMSFREKPNQNTKEGGRKEPAAEMIKNIHSMQWEAVF